MFVHHPSLFNILFRNRELGRVRFEHWLHVKALWMVCLSQSHNGRCPVYGMIQDG